MAEADEIPAEFLWALVEGRLDGKAEGALARYLRGRPSARRHLCVIAAHYRILSRADASVLNEPVPARLVRLIEAARRRLSDSA
ncbi:MAG: hypothetical protein D6757_04865 [Alphaproteobacteria bacterium]|nr:MAG: hypothetical protein D6757_04865 [Alphaproteobacteria bacterium]